MIDNRKRKRGQSEYDDLFEASKDESQDSAINEAIVGNIKNPDKYFNVNLRSADKVINDGGKIRITSTNDKYSNPDPENSDTYAYNEELFAKYDANMEYDKAAAYLSQYQFYDKKMEAKRRKRLNYCTFSKMQTQDILRQAKLDGQNNVDAVKFVRAFDANKLDDLDYQENPTTGELEPTNYANSYKTAYRNAMYSAFANKDDVSKLYMCAIKLSKEQYTKFINDLKRDGILETDLVNGGLDISELEDGRTQIKAIYNNPYLEQIFKDLPVDVGALQVNNFDQDIFRGYDVDGNELNRGVTKAEQNEIDESMNNPFMAIKNVVHTVLNGMFDVAPRTAILQGAYDRDHPVSACKYIYDKAADVEYAYMSATENGVNHRNVSVVTSNFTNIAIQNILNDRYSGNKHKNETTEILEQTRTALAAVKAQNWLADGVHIQSNIYSIFDEDQPDKNHISSVTDDSERQWLQSYLNSINFTDNDLKEQVRTTYYNDGTVWFEVEIPAGKAQYQTESRKTNDMAKVIVGKTINEVNSHPIYIRIRGIKTTNDMQQMIDLDPACQGNIIALQLYQFNESKRTNDGNTISCKNGQYTLTTPSNQTYTITQSQAKEAFALDFLRDNLDLEIHDNIKQTNGQYDYSDASKLIKNRILEMLPQLYRVSGYKANIINDRGELEKVSIDPNVYLNSDKPIDEYTELTPETIDLLKKAETLITNEVRKVGTYFERNKQ